MPSYQIQIHTTAKRELQALDERPRDRLTDTLAAVAREREPTSHEAVRPLEGHTGLFRVRVGDVRAVCSLQKPNLLVLKIGPRKSVYESIDSVDDRLETVA